jgi:hypothetical protein
MQAGAEAHNQQLQPIYWALVLNVRAAYAVAT